MRLTILNAVMLATTAALTAVNLQPPTADAKVETPHPMLAAAADRPMSVANEFDTIRAREIVLVNDKGEACITMLAGRDISGIWVHRGYKNSRTASIYVDDHQGPVIGLMGEKLGKGCPLAFSLTPDNKPIVQVVDDGKVDIFDAKTLIPKK